MTLELSEAEKTVLIMWLGMVRAGEDDLVAPDLYVGILAKLGVDHPEDYLRKSEGRDKYLSPPRSPRAEYGRTDRSDKA